VRRGRSRVGAATEASGLRPWRSIGSTAADARPADRERASAAASVRRWLAPVFAGDARVWKTAAVAAVPLLALIAYYCLRPVDYYTGTNSVEAYTYIAPTPAGTQMCVPGLWIPAGTGRIQLQLVSRTTTRPSMRMTLRLGGPSSQTIRSTLPATAVAASRISTAAFPIPRLASSPAERSASLCITAADLVNWSGTPLTAVPSPSPPTVGGQPVVGRIAIWYLPPAGSQSSYLSRAGAILQRAALFRPSPIGPWLYALILLVVLPGLALASVRCLALAVAHRSWSVRRTGAWLFAIAAINFACWAVITPPFQAPDEVDHFAYTQSLVQRGEAPARGASPLARWSSQETLALEDMSFFSDHQIGDSAVPWSKHQQAFYDQQARAGNPSASDGGGNETAATHGAIYYAALAPAYMLASSSPLSQLTLMRLTSALIGALTVLFAFLMGRELAPARPWLGVLAALLVAYQPMYGFISGAVNNDVGVNAGVAALELLLIVMLRRGITWKLGLATGVLLLALPIVKETSYSLYPVTIIALAATLYRHHRRSDLWGLGAVVLGAVALRELADRLAHVFRPSTVATSTPGSVGAVTGPISEALAHPLGYLAYLWEVFLPRLSFMARHFEGTRIPALTIFDERGWGAFGWYDVFFPHPVYDVILAAMLAVPVFGLIAIGREWTFVRTHALDFLVLALMPIAVVAGVEAAFYTTGVRPVIAEFGRYAFPAIAPLAVLVVASLHAFGRRLVLYAGVVLLVAMIALSVSSQLLTLTSFYA
jgi:Predicted membrane protein (DUF2142)